MRVFALLAPLLALLALLALACAGGGSGTAPANPEPTRAPTQRPAIAPVARPSPSAVAAPSPLVAGRALRYVAVGASDTVGVGAADPARDGWVPRLGRALGPDTTVRNLGVSGTTLHTALDDQVPLAVREQADLVTVWLAVNDLNAHVPLDAYALDLDRLLALVSASPRTVVLLANVLDLTLVPSYSDVEPTALRAEVQRWNAAIADAARRHDAHLVDLYAEYAELAARPELVSGDGFHPSSAGYARIADLFLEVARPALIDRAGR